MRPFELTSEPLKLSENDVEKQCMDYLRLYHWEPIRLHAGRFRTLDGKRVITGAVRGTPDYICIHHRHPAFYLEVKRPKGTLSPDQVKRHREIEIMGFAHIWVDSLDELEVLVKVLEGRK